MTYEIIEQQLRDAIAKAQESGWSINAIAKAAKLTQPTLCRFVGGKTGRLTPEVVDRLASHFGMRLTLTKPTKNTGKPKNA